MRIKHQACTSINEVILIAAVSQYVKVFLINNTHVISQESKKSHIIVIHHNTGWDGDAYVVFVCSQFQVKVHDLPEGSNTGGKGNGALNFLRTHQLKVCGPPFLLGIRRESFVLILEFD